MYQFTQNVTCSLVYGIFSFYIEKAVESVHEVFKCRIFITPVKIKEAPQQAKVLIQNNTQIEKILFIKVYLSIHLNRLNQCKLHKTYVQQLSL